MHKVLYAHQGLKAVSGLNLSSRASGYFIYNAGQSLARHASDSATFLELIVKFTYPIGHRYLAEEDYSRWRSHRIRARYFLYFNSACSGTHSWFPDLIVAWEYTANP